MKLFKIDQHPKIRPGFTVPQGYFENFEASIMHQLEPEIKVIPLNHNRKTWWFAAAAVLILSLTIPTINALSSSKTDDVAALDTYFAYNDVSEEQLVDLLDSEDIDNIKIDINLEDAAIEDALYFDGVETLLD